MSTDADGQLYEKDRTTRTRPFPEAEFSRTFEHRTVVLSREMRLHCVIADKGPPVVLLHGFPQHWWEWRHVMLALARAGHAVMAPDLRGFGLSDRPFHGFDVGTVGDDVRHVVRELGWQRVDLVGHDLGASVAYAWAAAHPDEVSRLVLMEAFPAGLEPASSAPPAQSGIATWHLGFMSTPDIPEVLLAGRERVLVEHLCRSGAYDQTAFADADIDAYARSLAAPGGVRAAASHIRAIPESGRLNKHLAERKLTLPVLAIGGEIKFRNRVGNAAQAFAENVMTVVANRCGHWIPEERPVWLAQQLIEFFAEPLQENHS